MAAPFQKPVVCPVLIDRVNDLAMLHALINQAKSGRGQVILLSGEAGIGKSRLVAETKAYAAVHGFFLLQGNCFQTDISYPYAPLLDLLRSSAANQLAATIASELAPFARELHQLLPDVVPLPPDQAPLAPSDPGQEKRRLFTALAHFFTGQAAKQPVLLIIEDIHWSDDISLEFLHHALTRQAIYADLLVRERKVLHRTVAETMERLYRSTLDAHLEDLAAHFSEAGAWEKALEYGQRAGEKAQALYAPQAAIEYFTRALDAAHHLALAPPPNMYRVRGQAFETLGDFERARSDYEQALERARAAHDRVAEWQSLIDLGFLWEGRDYDRGGVYYQQALDLARTIGDSSTLAHSLNRVGNWHTNIGQPFEALRNHQEALSMFRRLNDRRGIAETLDLLAVNTYLSGDLIQSTTYCEQAITLSRELDHRQLLVSNLVLRMLCSSTNYQTDTMVPAATGFAESLSLWVNWR